MEHLNMWKVDTKGTVEDGSMYHVTSGHTRNYVGWEHHVMKTMDTPGTVEDGNII